MEKLTHVESNDKVVAPEHLQASGDVLTVHEERDLKRGLSQRHVSMIALAGAIGTGLFLSLGGSISTGGPRGSLLGYLFIGLIVCAVQFALGEVSTLLPVTGSFVQHAEAITDPALGFALGWTIVYGTWLSIPSEISAICVLFGYWTDVNPSAWIMTFIVLTALVAYSKIRYFGEIEFVLAILKILLIVGIIFLGLITALGGVRGVERVGFRYWRDPGPFVPYIAEGSWGRFLGFWSVLINAVFSFSGIESIAMAAAEMKHPRAVIPKACKRVFARVALFYVLAVLVVGMIVPSNDPRLAEDSGTAATSPFVLATAAAGVKAIPHIVNAVVITSAWSSGNQALLSGSRVLYSLALKGQAPRLFLRTTRWGTPWAAVTTYVLSSFLAFMALSSSAITVFYWFVSLVGCGVLISWSCVLVNHIRLRMAFRVQGIDPHRLPWHNSWTPYSSAVALFFCIVILLTNGFAVFTKGNWSVSGFITAYLDIGLVAVVFLGWKLIKKTRWVHLADIPLEEILSAIEALPEEKVKQSPRPLRFISWLWD
ncbi:hypothetical protein CcaverHIS002_0211360 [Cutaneotrichosporon cavernicola]|uniref:Amino acid permease/ SLC12A domain-containing protein n=1 Tax=Cutaneotrichosporon cavernicola TaxID=279322 RepID=A0AA48IG66_9TREE|nr:uncharacterized protein CcaverHIS019_0211350 [Cutaneotrichosporon cavernicola]BEI81976.1 hypothetical protein CcaverHIS002_0211360 [Cutaneotrichosporon cavernicola]BEI89773.1 hypothetical protein CcaverHIS019_0211350 [Cutaneotrichosporon cavernicola]BEI97545.1 hypothetical protein CcaverHIS631_0211340 [Cutaneotrichosporon cavernicola]BEJ05323.1 hypothetical protein CcaverHIS641_0211400 [Cutaneotrichosporon cavernicola]